MPEASLEAERAAIGAGHRQRPRLGRLADRKAIDGLVLPWQPHVHTWVNIRKPA